MHLIRYPGDQRVWQPEFSPWFITSRICLPINVWLLNTSGRALGDEESLTIRPAQVLKDAPIGEERSDAFRRYLTHLDQLADRVKDVPEQEIDAAIDEARPAHYRMIVTLDTAILVRETKRSRGPARKVIDALASDSHHVIALSPFILG
jgi:hypothetical protein